MPEEQINEEGNFDDIKLENDTVEIAKDRQREEPPTDGEAFPPEIQITNSTKEDLTNIHLEPTITSTFDLLREEKVEQIRILKAKITSLISNVRDTKRICDKYENENQYLQDYVGSMMTSGEMKK